MKLLKSNLNEEFWLKNNYEIPKYDVEKVKENTLKEPIWIHFGAGNIFRVFPAKMQQNLINKGLSHKGIIVCECFDEEIIPKVFHDFDDLTIGVSLKVDGSIEKEIIGSIVQSLEGSNSMEELISIFEKESLQMVSFTITEKGYIVKQSDGSFFSFIQDDIKIGPNKAKSLMGIITTLLYKRFIKGAFPITLVSMDNCSHNGDKLYEAVYSIAKEWEDSDKVKKGFCEYINDPLKVAFPLSMIDKITPRPSEDVKRILKTDGIENCDIIKTSKNTYSSCFVNSEETGYLVIEDIFPNKRPCLENAGVIFTNRDTVDKIEKMKVCTCLNPLHTVLAIFGCLLGYESIWAEMEDEDLVKLIKKIGYDEGLKVVIDPGIISPKAFIDECINVRFPNKFMPDTPQRIACDTSLKIPVRFGETLKAYVKNNLDLSSLKYIPLFFAGWLKYLTGIGNDGKEFIQSPDPMLDVLKNKLKGVNRENYIEIAEPILSNKDIFGIDLYEYGLSERVLDYFFEMLDGEGSVRKVLKKYLD